MPPKRSTSSASRTRPRSSPPTARPSGSTIMPIRPRSAGSKLVIAGAGGAAHLPGMTASMTSLPVLGVPIETQALKGMDSLLSIVQMPAGIPVGTLAIGKAGAINAALLAAAMLATERRGARRRGSKRGARSRRGRWPKRPNDDPARLHHRHHRRRPARPDARAWPRPSSATDATSSTRTSDRPRPTSPRHFTRADFDDVAALEALRRRGRRRHLRVREFAGRAARRARRQAPARHALARHRAGPRARESSSSRSAARASPPWRAVATPGRRRRARSPSSALPLVLKTRRYGYDGKGQAWIRSRRRRASRLGRDRRGARGRRSRRRLRRRILGHRRALGGRPPRLLGLARERAWRRHPAPLDRAVQRRRRRPGRRSARGRAAHRRGARPRRRAHRRIFRQPRRARWSTRSRRASTTAATGRSRARSPRSSSSTSARSAAFRRARPSSSAAARSMDNLIGDDVDRWPELVAEPGAHVHIYGKGEAAPRPQDGPRHAGDADSPAQAGSPHYGASTTSIGMPSLSSCGLTLAASPTTTNTKRIGVDRRAPAPGRRRPCVSARYLAASVS